MRISVSGVTRFGIPTAILLPSEVNVERDELELEDLFISFTELYETAANSKDYTLCVILKEEMRKVLSNSGPMFRIDKNIDYNFYEV